MQSSLNWLVIVQHVVLHFWFVMIINPDLVPLSTFVNLIVGKENVLLKILRTPSVRRAVLVGSGLQLIQQVSGINTVM